MNLEELQIKIGIELKELNKQLKKASDDINEYIGPKATKKMMQDNNKVVKDGFKDMEKTAKTSAKQMRKEVTKEFESMSKDISKSLNKAFELDMSKFNKNLTRSMNDAKTTVRSACNDIRRELNAALNIKANVRVNSSVSSSGSNVASRTSDAAAIMQSSQYTGAMIAKAVNEMIKVSNANTARIEASIRRIESALASEIGKLGAKLQVSEGETRKFGSNKGKASTGQKVNVKANIETSIRVVESDLQSEVNKAINSLDVSDIKTSIVLDENLQSDTDAAINRVIPRDIEASIKLDDNSLQDEVDDAIRYVDVPELEAIIELEEYLQNDVNRAVREVNVPELNATLDLEQNLQDEVNDAVRKVDVPELNTSIELEGDLQNEVNKAIREVDVPELKATIELEEDLQSEINSIVNSITVPNLKTTLELEQDLQTEVNRIIEGTELKKLKTSIEIDEKELQLEANLTAKHVKVPKLITNIEVGSEGLQEQVNSIVKTIKAPKILTGLDVKLQTPDSKDNNSKPNIFQSKGIANNQATNPKKQSYSPQEVWDDVFFVENKMSDLAHTISILTTSFGLLTQPVKTIVGELGKVSLESAIKKASENSPWTDMFEKQAVSDSIKDLEYKKSKFTSRKSQVQSGLLTDNIENAPAFIKALNIEIEKLNKEIQEQTKLYNKLNSQKGLVSDTDKIKEQIAKSQETFNKAQIPLVSKPKSQPEQQEQDTKVLTQDSSKKAPAPLNVYSKIAEDIKEQLSEIFRGLKMMEGEPDTDELDAYYDSLVKINEQLRKLKIGKVENPEIQKAIKDLYHYKDIAKQLERYVGSAKIKSSKNTNEIDLDALERRTNDPNKPDIGESDNNSLGFMANYKKGFDDLVNLAKKAGSKIKKALSDSTDDFLAITIDDDDDSFRKYMEKIKKEVEANPIPIKVDVNKFLKDIKELKSINNKNASKIEKTNKVNKPDGIAKPNKIVKPNETSKPKPPKKKDKETSPNLPILYSDALNEPFEVINREISNLYNEIQRIIKQLNELKQVKEIENFFKNIQPFVKGVYQEADRFNGVLKDSYDTLVKMGQVPIDEKFEKAKEATEKLDDSIVSMANANTYGIGPDADQARFIETTEENISKIFETLGKPCAFFPGAFKEAAALNALIKEMTGVEPGADILNEKKHKEAQEILKDSYNSLKHLSSEEFKLKVGSLDEFKIALETLRKSTVRMKEDFNSSEIDVKFAKEFIDILDDVKKRIEQIEDDELEIKLRADEKFAKKASEQLFDFLKKKTDETEQAFKDLYESAIIRKHIPIDIRLEMSELGTRELQDGIEETLKSYNELKKAMGMPIKDIVIGADVESYKALKAAEEEFKEKMNKDVPKLTRMDDSEFRTAISGKGFSFEEIAAQLKVAKKHFEEILDDADSLLSKDDAQFCKKALKNVEKLQKKVDKLLEEDFDFNTKMDNLGVNLDLDDLLTKLKSIQSIEDTDIDLDDLRQDLVKLLEQLDKLRLAETDEIKIKVVDDEIVKATALLKQLDDVRRRFRGGGGNIPPRRRLPGADDFPIRSFPVRRYTGPTADVGNQFDSHVAIHKFVKLKNEIKEQLDGIKAEYKGLVSTISKITDKLTTPFKKIASSLKGAASVTKSAWDKITSIFRKGTKDCEKSVSSLKGSMGGLGSSLRSLAGMFGLYRLGSIFIDGTKQAMQYEAAVMTIKRTLGGASKSLIDFANNNAQAFGLSKSKVMEFGNIYSVIVSNFEKDATKAANTTQKLLESAGIIAGATGYDVNTVLENLRSGILGSAVAVDQLGLNLKTATLESSQAFKEIGKGAKSWEELTETQKQAIIAQEIINQTTSKYGGIVKNTASMHNAFMAQLNNTKLALGQVGKALYTAILPALTTIMAVLEKVFTYAAQAITSLLSVFGITVDFSASLGGVDNTLGDSVGESFDDAKDSVEEAEEAVEKFKGSLMGFDEINILSDNSDKKDNANNEDTGTGVGEILPPEITEGENPFDKFAEKFKAFIDEVLEPFKKAWEIYGDDLIKEWGDLKESFKNFCDSLSNFLKSVWDNGGKEFVQHLAEIGLACAKAAMEIGGEILDSLARLWDHLDPSKNMHTQRLLDVLNEVSEKIRDFILGLGDHFESLMANGGQDVLNALGDCFMDLGAAAVNGLGVVIDALDGLIDHLDPAVNENTRNMLQALADMFHAVGEAAWDFSELLRSALENGGQDMINAFGDMMMNLGETVARVITTMMESFSKFFDYIDPAKNDITKGMMKAWEEAFLAIGDMALGFADLFESVMANGGQDVLNKFGDAFNSLVGLVGTCVQEIADAMNGLFEHLDPKTNEFTQNMLKAWEEAFESISGMAKDIGEVLGSVMDNGGQEVVNAIGDLGVKIVGAFGKVTNTINITIILYL